MQTREDINVLSDVRPFCFETDREKTWYNIGLIDGLEVGDNEPQTDSLWHNPNEKPQDGRSIIVYLYDGNAVVLSRVDEYGMFYIWEHWFYLNEQRCWAYVDDMLPKFIE